MGKYPYIVAEIGGNHNGDIELGKKMIKAAKECTQKIRTIDIF